ncbi:MAG: hypothetical protein HOG43_00565 [Flavobacteriales bacterium]|nr:hypothetical protein [Flavobacteriales bacterium]
MPEITISNFQLACNGKRASRDPKGVSKSVILHLSPTRLTKNIMSDKPGPAFHEKKDKNKKTFNLGGGEKIKMNRAKKHKKPLTRGPKRKK